MCKFQKNTKLKNLKCDYQSIDLGINIPEDADGLCIFHSESEQWKIENEFSEFVEKLIGFYEKSDLKEIVLEGIYFIGDCENLFSNRTFDKTINLNGAFFSGQPSFISAHFTYLKIEEATFCQDITFAELIVFNLMLSNSSFKKKLSLNKLTIKDNFYLENCELGSGISGNEIDFQGKVFFTNVHTNLDKNIRHLNSISLKKVCFHEFTRFESCEFNFSAFFMDIRIVDSVAFHETVFNFGEPVPIVASVNFEKINIEDKGLLEFRGGMVEKMFSKVHDVIFQFSSLNGRAFFENVDFTKFTLPSKSRILDATKGQEAKIAIGSGCFKYYNQTPIKSLLLSKDNQNLAKELCNTFIDYFVTNRGYNLGVEFVSRTDESIHFYYFSDEIMSYDEFESQLKSSEREMWSLVRVDHESFHGQIKKGMPPSRVLKASDSAISIVGILLKIAARVKLFKIKPSEINALLSSTGSEDNSMIDSEKVQAININQISLFSLGGSQSVNLKKKKGTDDAELE